MGQDAPARAGLASIRVRNLLLDSDRESYRDHTRSPARQDARSVRCGVALTQPSMPAAFPRLPSCPRGVDSHESTSTTRM